MQYKQCLKEVEQILQIEKSFDIVKRKLLVQNTELSFLFVDGMIKDDVMERIMEHLLLKGKISKDIQMFADENLAYVEVSVEHDIGNMVTGVLSGACLLLVEGCEDAVLLDVRTYPVRSMQEPEDERVLRGSRDGFVETLIFNTALIRRRIRDSHLRMEYHSVGETSKTDVVLCYMENKADKNILKNMQMQLDTLKVQALTMTQESIVEALVPHTWWNPFPKVRYTERPDTAASNILEGKILLLVDTSPSAMILPTSFFDFVQEPQDYYLPPVTGNYLRFLRILVFFASLCITPLWFHFITNPQLTPSFLNFILLKETPHVPILLQLLLMEIGIDILKTASLNTPNALNNSFSLIGALVLGDFAVQAGWLNAQVILYMAFAAMANFTQASYELGYALKFLRIMLLLFIALIPKIGILIGIVFVLLVMANCKTITKTSYFYPLFPFHPKALKKLFVREKIRSQK